jgi:uncharacterized glyoxalase superfamily protein PhnB
MPSQTYINPFRPGAGHMPSYLAGRAGETKEFQRLLAQSVVLDNLVLTGLRGVGKTVLLDSFKPLAIEDAWLWVGTDLTEAASLNEENVVVRLLADLAVVTSGIVIGAEAVRKIGFRTADERAERTLTFDVMADLYAATPGLVSDKLKATLEFVWQCTRDYTGARGIIFAYDEAQNLSDKSDRNEFPLSLMLDVFQSLQKRDMPLMLILAGLPTLFPKLVKARTFAERMFRVVFLDRLKEADTRTAILNPIEQANSVVRFSEEWIDAIVRESGGYPYFIQFLSREAFDAAVQHRGATMRAAASLIDITRKLDTDFFAGRWARVTDRQRELLSVVAQLPNSDEEFTPHDVVARSKEILAKPFNASHVSQMFSSLCDAGMMYRNRHGRYSFAVPLLGRFILRMAGIDQQRDNKP